MKQWLDVFYLISKILFVQTGIEVCLEKVSESQVPPIVARELIPMTNHARDCDSMSPLFWQDHPR